MLTTFQAAIMGLIQGITELFPISSLGHSVIIPKLFGWQIDQNAPYFLTFLVATHLATATVLFIFFWRDWVKIIKGVGRTIDTGKLKRNDIYARLGWLLIIGTVPAGLIGFVLDSKLRHLFATPLIAAIFLIVNGGLLFGAEYLRRKANDREEGLKLQSDAAIAKLRFTQALGVGAAQALALIPGISRSGSSMAGGLLVGLSNENAARFSFLLATPVIGAAALLKLPLLFSHQMASMRGAILVGALCAAITAFISVKFLLKFFETNTLKPFAYYCLAAGVIFSAICVF